MLRDESYRRGEAGDQPHVLWDLINVDAHRNALR